MTFPTHLLGFTNQATNQIAYSRVSLGAASTEFTVPDGVYQISGVVIGGGGGGNGSDGTGNNNSNGGSGGALCWGTFSVLPGDVLKLDIAQGGARGNALDGTAGSGFEGGNTAIFLVERGGTDYRPSPIEILFAEGGDGGIRGPAGAAGGQGLASNSTTPEIIIFDSGAYQGGSGGYVPDVNDFGAGGGGAAGYAGNGGNGGNQTSQPTDAATGSGGGGGGGSREDGLGFGGGGAGSFGFDAGTQGDAGVNEQGGTPGSGGTGGSFFEDPGLSIRAEKVGETIAVTGSGAIIPPIPAIPGPGITTIAIPPGTQDDDFLLLLSASDRDSGLPANTPFPVPVGFTTFNQSTNGEYYVSFADFKIAQSGGTGFTTEAIANNIADGGRPQYQNRDLNFANSYQFVDDITSFVEDPPGSGQRCVSGLTSIPAIHNLISLRFVPRGDGGTAQVNWVAASGDPSWNNPPASSMPDPPAISGISSGSIAVTLGYLANTILNPSGNIAPSGYTAIPDVADDFNEAPETTSCVAAYKLITSTGTETPGKFRTGTASHSRGYTLELNSDGGASPIQFVGYGTVTEGDSNFNLNTELRDTSGNVYGTNQMQNDDLVIVATSGDSPGNDPDIPQFNGGDMTSFITANSVGGATEDSFGVSGDIRQTTGTTPGMRYGIWYERYDGSDATISNIDNTGGAAPSANLVLVFRNVDTAGSPFRQTPEFLDTNDVTNANGIAGIAEAPQGPAQSMNSGSMSLIIGMIDDQKVSLVDVITAPIDSVDSQSYTMLSQASYGEQGDGVIIMSAIREDCQGTTNPSSFVANGSNIWASQTIVIGGPGSQTGGSDSAAGQYGGGGGGRSRNSNGQGMSGADGAVRLIWGASRLYPFRDGNTGNFTVIDFVS